MSLPASDAVFVKAYYAETAEAFCDGHAEAFAFFGEVPLSILYDTTKLAVAQILGDGERKRSRMFEALQSHCLFEDRFGRPARGNDKGNVEGMVGFTRRTFMVPIASAVDIDELNVMLLERCGTRIGAVLRPLGECRHSPAGNGRPMAPTLAPALKQTARRLWNYRRRRSTPVTSGQGG